MRYLAAPYESSSVCYPAGVEGNLEEGSSAGKLRANQLSLSLYVDTQVRVGSWISDNDYLRDSVSHLPKAAEEVCVGHFRAHDPSMACTLAQRRDWRRYGTMPLNTRPRPFATPLWVGRS